MAGYDKDFLVAAFMSRFIRAGVGTIEDLCELEDNAYKLYDRVGKDEFRVCASLDAAAIREFKNG